MRIMFLLLAVLAVTAPFASQAQEPAPAEEYRSGSEAYRIDSETSWLRVLAYPDGPLRRFGHHHVISHHGISGVVEVAPDPLESTFLLELAVAELKVDDPALRELEGEDFEGEISQEDIEGTRGNMLGEELLHGVQFPAIRIQSTAINGSLPDVDIVTKVIVKGMENTVTFPASIELMDDSFVARGEVELTHGELGLSPFSAAGGALRVRDTLVIKYEIRGSRSMEGE